MDGVTPSILSWASWSGSYSRLRLARSLAEAKQAHLSHIAYASVLFDVLTLDRLPEIPETLVRVLVDKLEVYIACRGHYDSPSPYARTAE